MTDTPDIQRLSTHLVYENPWTRVHEDRILRRDGSEGLYGYVEKPDFVIVVALQDGMIQMVEQYRYPVGTRLWELPQGTAEGSSFQDIAATELREETGYTANTWRAIGSILPGSGILSNRCHAFLATDLVPGEIHREAAEIDMISRAIPVEEVLDMIRAGVLVDGPSLAALMFLKLEGTI